VLAQCRHVGDFYHLSLNGNAKGPKFEQRS
jgi:hypothetical protein